tara:strand:- start:221 stop:1324 length:1104 start_codon:yes stop_codon:yes gene_type:complete
MKTHNKIMPINNQSDVHVNLKITKVFTDEHLETSLKLSPVERFPKIFANRSLPNVKYIGRFIMSMNDIESDNVSKSQEIRLKNNKKESKIRHDIDTEGYDLSQLTPAVMRKPNKKAKTIDSRTRQLELRSKGCKNIIVDVFEEMSNIDFRRLGQLYNNILKTHGESEYLDIRKTVLANVADIGMKTEKEIIKEIRIQCGHKLTEAQENMLVADAINQIKGETAILSFNKGDGTSEWLVKNHYINGVDPILGKHIIYKCISAFEEKVHMIIMKYWEKNPKVDKDGYPYEIRLIIHGSTLDKDDVVANFINKCVEFPQNFKKYETSVSENRFGGTEIQPQDNMIIFGTIPMLRALEHKYPMNKLILFNQ